MDLQQEAGVVGADGDTHGHERNGSLTWSGPIPELRAAIGQHEAAGGLGSDMSFVGHTRGYVVLGPLHIASAVLILAGVSKVANPAAARGALGVLGMRWPAALVRMLGAAEVGLGVVVIVRGGRAPAALLAGAYLA